jgi:short-subunit dehydrogenase
VTVVCPGGVATEIHQGAGHVPADTSGLMSAAECARIILRAARKRKREELLTFAGKAGNVLRPLFPGLVDGLVRREIEKFFAR